MNTTIPKTRRKVNFKNYKEVCKALKEQEYKRGSKEKEEQIKRWEKNLHIHKQKDNSFTHIDEDFKTQKQINKIKTIKRKEEKLNMLKVKFMRHKNVVIMEILNQTMKDYEILTEKEFRASNGFKIECEDYPEIVSETKIYLKGDKSENNTTCYDFETTEKAKNFVIQASLAIKEYNEIFKEKNKNETTSYFDITIVE